MEPMLHLYVLFTEHIPYLFTASLPVCQIAWELGISKKPLLSTTLSSLVRVKGVKKLRSNYFPVESGQWILPILRKSRMDAFSNSKIAVQLCMVIWVFIASQAKDVSLKNLFLEADRLSTLAILGSSLIFMKDVAEVAYIMGSVYLWYFELVQHYHNWNRRTMFAEIRKSVYNRLLCPVKCSLT